MSLGINLGAEIIPDKVESQSEKIHLLPFVREEVLSIQDIAQRAGWEITAFDLPSAWLLAQGEGVVVAVLDTGCDLNHNDLKDNLVQGKNFVNPLLPPEDDNSHGSHCVGTICALNNDYGIVGVAPKTKVMPVKVLDGSGSGNLEIVAKGIVWAANQGVDFIVMSLGSPNPTPVIHDAIKYAASKNVITFCAAGNAGKTRQIFYPAAYPETIGIGAIDKDFDRADFSCTGPDLDFLAPGVKILSTVPENWYAVLSGTSMANPFAVGIACLLLSWNRKNENKIKLNCAKDYIDVFKNYTIPIINPQFAGDKFFEGFGIIDPRKLKEWMQQQVNH
jgi:subtilisin family serine protease